MKVGVLGGGQWGQALARVILAAGHEPLIAWRDVRPPHTLPSTDNPPEVSEQCDLLLVAVSGAQVRQAIRLAKPGPHNRVVVAGRGVEPKSGDWLTDVVLQESSALRVGALAGPAPVEEVLHGGLCAGVIASPFEEVRTLTIAALHSTRYRVYHSPDLRGVQIAAASVPVVSALLALTGELKGAGSGLNALVLTRALSELSRLVESTGGTPETLYGLAGLGDLLAAQAGERHAPTRVEGRVQLRPGTAALAQTLIELAKAHRVDLPLIGGLLAAHQGANPLEIVGQLMARKPQPEQRK